MKKCLAVMVISIMTVLTLSGCYPTGKKVSENSSSVASESTHLDGTHFEYSKENLAVSFDLPEIPDELPSRIKLKEKTFDHREVIELFFEGEAPVSEYLYGVNKDMGQYTASDGSKLTIEGNNISYSSAEMQDDLKSPVDYGDIVHLCNEYVRDKYSITEDELEVFPLQGALDSVKDLITKLGLSGFGEPRIYSVSLASYEKMKSEYYMFNDEYPLTKDNEIYVFEFPRLFGEVEGLNLNNVKINDPTSGRRDLIGSASISVVVARDGILDFNIGGAYETDYEVLSTEPVKYDLSYAVSELEKHLDKVYFSSKKNATVKNAKIVYYPVERNEPGTVEFTPAWSFEGYYRDMDFESEVNHMFLWDYRLFVNSDVGVVKEYSEG